MSLSLLAKAYGISQEVWAKIPSPERQKLLEAFEEGKYDLVKQLLAKFGMGNPEIASELKIPIELIQASQWSDWFGKIGFSLENLTKKAELRGLIGVDCWTDNMLRMVLSRYRRHCLTEGIPENKADIPLQTMAKTLQLDLNHLRRLFYGIKLEEKPLLPKKVEPIKKESKEEISSEAERELGKRLETERSEETETEEE